MAILTVGPHSTYADIATAMTFASPGDEISLETGYANETATVTVENLTISGGNYASTGIDLTLGAGISAVTLTGKAPIHVFDNSGDNTITGNVGNSVIEVSSGNDVVHGGGPAERLIVDYGSATDVVIGTAVNISDGGTHAVTFDGVTNFTIRTGSASDTITSGDGRNVINTGAGSDTITSGNGHNVIFGGQGNDTITAGDGGNDLWGGHGNDTVTSGLGNDIVKGNLGDDTVTGGGGNDDIFGGGGNDTLSGGAGDDHLTGGVGNNTLDGGADSDTADYSGSGLAVTVDLGSSVIQAVSAVENDTLTSIENLTGSSHNDSLTGDSGANVLTGKGGSDDMNGGGGADTFSYLSVDDSTSRKFDVITGFDGASDSFNLQFAAVNAIDTAVTLGHLSMSSFEANMAAAVGASELAGHDAVLFTADSGTLSGDTFLVVDVNGVAGYQAGADLIIQLDAASNLGSLSSGSFV